jgi:hypothetical protein
MLQGAEPAERAGEARLRGAVVRSQPKSSSQHVKVPTAMTSALGQSHGVSQPLPAWLRRPWGFCPASNGLSGPRFLAGSLGAEGGTAVAARRNYAHMQRNLLRNAGWSREARPVPITRKEVMVVLHKHHPQTSTWSGLLPFVVSLSRRLFAICDLLISFARLICCPVLLGGHASGSPWCQASATHHSLRHARGIPPAAPSCC